MGSSTENSAFVTDAQPVGPRRACPAARRAARRPRSPPASRRRRLGTDTGGSIRQPAALLRRRRPQADLRPRLALRPVAFASLARPGRPVRARRRGRRADARGDRRPRSARLDLGRDRRCRDYAARARPRASRACASACPTEYFVDGLDAEVEAAVRAAIDDARAASARRSSASRCRTPSTALAAYYLDRARRGVVEPRALRRRAVRPARRRRARPRSTCTAGRAATGFGAEVKRRIMLGTYALSAGYYDAYYGKAQKVRTLIRRDFEDAFERVRRDRRARPRRASPFKLGEKADPLAMYLTDVFTIPVNLAGMPGLSVPAGFTQAGPADRAAAHRPRLRRGDAAARGARLRARDRLAHRRPRLGQASEAGRERARTRRSSGSRCTRSSRRATKMFCGCATAFGAAPNTQTCPVCLGMPGSLPVINRRAVEFGIKTALALGCTVNARNRFARKHYFYPDLPKNYQISQYDEPLAEHGRLAIDVAGTARGTIRVQRLHLEEDAGKLIHEGGARDGGGEPGRLQPRRRAADGDRLPARICAAPRRPPRTCAPSAPSCSTWASATATWRRARCAATPTSRCGRAGRRARHQDRDQEPELVPERPARARVRGRAPGARPRRGRADRAGDAAVGSRPGPDRLDALEGVRARLPLLPRAGPAAARTSSAGWIDEIGAGPARAAGGAPRALRTGLRPLGLRRRAAHPGPGTGRLLRGGGARPRQAEDRRQLDPERAPARAAGR